MPEESIKKRKADLRRRLLLQRQQMTSSDISSISTKICEHLAVYIAARHFSRILTYVPFRNELDVFRNLIQLLPQHPKMSLYLPRIDQARRLMNFHLYQPQSDRLEKSTYGIEEPGLDKKLFDEREGGLSLILVPALALDVKGVRLGYGAGYYDRFLAKVANITNTEHLGIISDSFILPDLPCSNHDFTLSAYVSESGIRQFPRIRI